jgi:hypothetical protein
MFSEGIMGFAENVLKKINDVSCVKYQPELYSDRLSSSDIERFTVNKKKLAMKIACIKLMFEKDNNISSTKAYEVLEEKCQNAEYFFLKRI